jgi:hypothetical protein
MRAPPVHRLTVDTHDIFTHRAGSYLALFDLGTYTRYVAREADALDIRAHLQRQTQALTILAWDARQPVSRLDLVALAGDELLETCAREPEFDLLHSAASGRPRLLDVPPGTYTVQVFAAADDITDLIVLRHHPFPPPRVAPVRLGGLTI